MGSQAYGGLLGITLHLASTPEDEKDGGGMSGLLISGGLLVARVDAVAIGGQTVLAPMIFAGGELSPPQLLYCLLIRRRCPATPASARH